MSSENTSRKVETGGFLAGHEFENHYVLDTLFLPTQVGYSDRFECTNNVQISDFFQEKPDLTLLGIIHTHPGFDAYLSSVDLHMLQKIVP